MPVEILEYEHTSGRVDQVNPGTVLHEVFKADPEWTLKVGHDEPVKRKPGRPKKVVE